MTYLHSVTPWKNIDNVYPWVIPGYQFSNQASFDGRIVFFTGDNGVGKSTLLETIGKKLHERRLLSDFPELDEFEPAMLLAPEFTVQLSKHPAQCAYLRAEELGREVERYNHFFADWARKMDLEDCKNERHVIQMMKNEFRWQAHSSHSGLKHKYEACSQGEAYLDKIQKMLNGNGLYLLDEPEAALSPLKQIMLICLLNEHLKHHQSQFLVATHSPILLATPDAVVNEIDNYGIATMDYKDTEHFQVTLGFLQNPERYLRFLAN